MKKSFYFFFVVLLFGTISLSAQNFATKGTVELGGSLGFSSTTMVYDGNSSDNSVSTFSIEPYVGYFVINSLELGLIPSFSTSSYGDQSSTSFGVYFAPAWNFDLRSNLYPFIEGRIGYNTSSYDDGNSETNDPSSSGLAWGFRGGVKVQVGNSSLVNIALSYDQMTMEPENWSGGRIGQNVFGVNAGFTIFLGR
ncbi:MAG: outer membrane beta-barrel protein [Ignavibacterium sp.]|nr:outer membrane beta-barrel protein [Ignavibacterium sp.]